MLSKLIFAFCVLTLTGCTSLDRALFDRTEEVQEQIVRVPATTNEVRRGNEVLLVVTPESTETNLVTNTVFAVKPSIASGLALAQSANQLANPSPSAPLINLALGGLAGLLGYVARVKSKRAALVPTLVEAIEETREHSGPIKEAVQRIATSRGQNDTLHRIVKELTK